MMNWGRLYRYLFQILGLRHEGPIFQPVIVVTGCGSGIGLALADFFYAQPRYRVVITARAHSLPFLKERFQENDRFWVHELDVTEDSQRRNLIESVLSRWGAVHILINNAGISYRSVIEHMTPEDEVRQMAVNYFGPMELTRLILPSMRDRGRGKLIYISSVSGMMAMPTMGAYSASKYALEGACEALWYEAKPYGIDVVLVQPGFVHSRSFENVYMTAKAKESIASGSVYSDYYAHMAPFVEKLMRISPTTPEQIAKLVLRIIRTENPPLWWPATLDAVLFYYVRRIVPRRFLLPFLFFCLPGAKNWGKKHTKRRGRA